MGKRSYSPEQKAEALRLYPELGASETAALLGIPRGTIREWAQAAGIRSDDPAVTGEARKAAEVRIAVKRARLRESLLDRAIDLEARMDRAHHDYRGKDAERVEWDVATSADVRNYAGAISTLIDKFRLESGEHTESSRTEAVTPRTSLAGKVDVLTQRREKRSA